MKRIMLAVFVICGALSLSGCILPPGPHGGGHGGDHFHGPEHRYSPEGFHFTNEEKGRKNMRPLVTTS